MLKFIKISGTNQAVDIISDRLFKELDSGKRLLWIVSGGGNITIEVEAMRRIPENLQSNLVVMVGDERYGPPGHKDSNYQQLLDAGFDAGKARLIPSLVEADTSLELAAKRINVEMELAINASDAIITQLGIGTDGHISGILPHTAATNAGGTVFSYRTDQYERLTMTFESLRKSTAIYAFAFGEAKLEQLTMLHDEALPIDNQPAQFLKNMPEAYVYSDQVGGDEQ